MIFNALTFFIDLIEKVLFDGVAAWFFNIFKFFFTAYGEIAPFIAALFEIFALMGG